MDGQTRRSDSHMSERFNVCNLTSVRDIPPVVAPTMCNNAPDEPEDSGPSKKGVPLVGQGRRLMIKAVGSVAASAVIGVLRE